MTAPDDDTSLVADAVRQRRLPALGAGPRDGPAPLRRGTPGAGRARGGRRRRRTRPRRPGPDRGRTHPGQAAARAAASARGGPGRRRPTPRRARPGPAPPPSVRARRDPPTRGRRRRAGRRARPAPHPDRGAGQGTHRDPCGGRRRGGAGRPPWSPAVHAGQRRPAVPGDRRGDGRRRRHRLRARDHPLRQPAAGRSGRSRPRRAPRPGRHRARRRVRGGHARRPCWPRPRPAPPTRQSSSWSTRTAPPCRCSPR